jgi:predicted SnoaL-like aldol condensation-catalyzing enzyme
MSTEENKAVIRQLVDEVYNNGNIGSAGKFFDTACILHHPAVPVPMQGVETVQGFITGILGAFPDFQITVEDLIAEGDKVVNRATISGTFKGAFGAIPPTGKRATWTATGIYRIVDGKVTEAWEDVDMLGGFQRLGVIPALG